MKKITIYVHDVVEDATNKILKEPEELLADWLWDHNLEVVNIRSEIINNESEAFDKEDEEEFYPSSGDELDAAMREHCKGCNKEGTVYCEAECQYGAI